MAPAATMDCRATRRLAAEDSPTVKAGWLGTGEVGAVPVIEVPDEILD